MLLRMLVRAAVLRRGRAMAALLAMIVAAATVTTMLNLYVDVQAKLGKEFRNYGANIVVVAKNGQLLSEGSLETVKTALGGQAQAVPFAFVVARTASGKPVVVAGTDLDAARAMDRWWSVTAWPTKAQQALVGSWAAAALNLQHADFDLTFQNRRIHLSTAGTVQTGASEDSRIYLSLPEFENWTGVRPSTIEVAVPGAEVSGAVEKLSASLPAAEVRPIRQIADAEARVLGKTRKTLLASSILIIATAALCLLATLIGWVYDRRRDFAIMKALGASQRLLGAFFAAEAAALGVVGATAGFGLGTGLAAWIGRVNFHAPVVPRFEVFPVVLVGSVAVAMLAAVVPISLLRRVEPANILRGE